MGRVLLAALLLGSLSPALAAPRSIGLVNATGAPLRDIAIKPEDKNNWTEVSPGLSPGARTRLTVDPDLCAYDLRATAAGAALTWRGINLCETSSVTLNRRADGVLWVDYD